MYYISKGLKEKGFQTLGKISAIIFAIFCIGGSFGGGNAAQSNQATIVIKKIFGWDSTAAGAIVGVVLALLVGIIIIGGIKRIASVTEKVVPFMALMYLLACVYILGSRTEFAPRPDRNCDGGSGRALPCRAAVAVDSPHGTCGPRSVSVWSHREVARRSHSVRSGRATSTEDSTSSP